MIAQMDGDHLTLITRATPAILAVLPALEGRRTWLKGGGLKVEGTVHNVEQLKAAFPTLEIKGAAPDIELFEVQAAPQSFAFKREPDPHQLTAFEQCQARCHFGLFMEQGTGKTKVAIDRACQLFLVGRITGVLVVTKKGVHRQWVDAELPKDHGPAFKADWWRNKALPPELMVQGNELKWFSINYDALRGKGFDAAAQFCAAHRGKLFIIADESQCIMNHTSLRHKKMMELKAHSSYRMLLTGTPIAKDLTDEWAQLRWLDDNIIGIKYLTTFRAQYCIMGGFEGRQVVGQKNMDIFKAKVRPHTYRVTKAEIGYIPKRYGEWVYDLSTEQRRLILQVKQELMAELDSGETVPIASATAAFTKAQQIANGFIIDENGKVVPLMSAEKNPRIIAMLEWLDSHEGKAVIWTRFIADRQFVSEVLSQAGIGVAEYSGSDEERHNAKRSFTERDARVFLANPQSAGTGTDGLQTVCTQALYYSNSFNSIDRWQSEDRIDRRGSIGGSNYTDLIGKGGPDRYILRSLKKKKGLSAMSLDDIQEAFSEAELF